MVAFSVALISLTTPAFTQEGPPPGCYTREYSQAHLDAHPDQVARAVHLWVQDQDLGGGSTRYAYLVVDFADQGHVRRDGHGAQRLDQSLVCFGDAGGRKGCAVDCDGGAFFVTRETAESLTIATETLWVGDTEGCGGAIDLAEIPGREVKYRLNRMDEAHCLSLIEN